MRELCDAVYGNKHVLSTAGDLHFGAIDVHEAQRRFFKLSAPSRRLKKQFRQAYLSCIHFDTIASHYLLPNSSANHSELRSLYGCLRHITQSNVVA